MKNLIISLVLVVAVGQLSAQTTLNESPSKNRISTRFGIEPTTMLGIIYERNFDVGLKNRKLTAYGEFNSSFFRYGLDNSEIKIGGIIPIVQYGSFMVINNLGFSTGHTTNRHFESRRFAVSDEIAAGLYKTRWFVATTFEYEKIYRSHIEHTEFYRTTYYPDAKDGWYKGAGGFFQLGIEGGRTFKEKVDLHMELKFPFTEKFNAYGGAGMHLNIGVGYRF